MNKRIAVLLAALALFSGVAFGQDYSKDGMLVAPGSINANIGVAYGYGFGVVGGFEYGIGMFKIAELPFTYGAAARGGFYLAPSFGFAVGGLGTLHFSLSALKLPAEISWIGNFDLYMGLGLGYNGAGLGFGWMSGTSYYFSKNMAVYGEGGFAGSGVGLIFKL